jgi:hypothetical protein
MKQALDSAYPQKTIGLAGAFLIKAGKIRAHVMPDFPKVLLFSLGLTVIARHLIQATIRRMVKVLRNGSRYNSVREFYNKLKNQIPHLYAQVSL